jgi:hypothetical protein
VNLGFAQKLGYELRTNGKSYITISHKIHDKGGLELRHKTALNENRFTYRHNFIFEGTPIIFSVPLHYKVEQNEPTFEPRLIYKFEKFKLWAQQEFWDELYNLALAVDIPYKNYIYRIGWDNSQTIRFRFSIKI